MTARLIWASFAFIDLLAALLFVAYRFGILWELRPHQLSACLSIALVLMPYWFLGFGTAESVRRFLDRSWKRVLTTGAFSIPYLVFSVPRGQFDVILFLELLGTLLVIACIRERIASPWLVLLLLVFGVEFPPFRNAWPLAGLSGVAKLIFVDAGLFAFLVIRPLDGIGFDWQIRWRDLGIGFRDFCFFAPIAIPLGFVLHFLHWRFLGVDVIGFFAGWLFTLLFVAVPEEIFFRGLLLNLLERLWGTRRALIASALIFGLAHFPKRAVFNWRYVILAAIAGIFYGRAWLDRRRVLTAGITHATVDAVWSTLFR